MKTVIVEDSALVVASLRQLLQALPEIEVAGTAATEAAAVELIQRISPDLVLLDLGLAAGSGLNVLERIRAGGSTARVLVVTNNAFEDYRTACLAAGAQGFFDKSRDTQALFDTLAAWLPPAPANEAGRLRALRRLKILDTPAEEVFDEVTRLVADLLGVPIALISLVDERRQWFKSRVGLPVRETPREVAFCAHTICQGELFVVEDAVQDPRFAENPLVRGEPRIRFYAGAPLVLPGGEAIGSLCAIDHAPRRLTEVQQRLLGVLAHKVVTELELRQRVSDLEEEVERRRAAEVHIMHLATRDPLTGLPNRAALMDRLRQSIKAAARDRHPLAFMFLDLDRFKLVNDSLGHHVGDALLQQVGERLTAALRDSDTVARLGGDEFAVILPRVESAAHACGVAAKLIAAVGAPMEAWGHGLRADCSIGLALWPEHGEECEALIRHADLAMYHAKQGASRYQVYAPEMNARAVERLTLQTDLHRAPEAGEFTLHYQPQLGVLDGRLTGVEALVRWNHPRLGLVPPLRFIPLAEETGLIWGLGRQVLDAAVAQMAAWREAGWAPPRVAVNVSPAQLRPEFAGIVRAALERHALPAACLELEITESALTSDGPQVLELLDELKRLGVAVAVDDFGVGYSSLALLRTLPLTTLKIDRSFTEGIAENRQDATIVQCVMNMAHGLGLRVVAEGVEDEAQHVALRVMGCDDAQGYLYSRPLPPEELLAWQATPRP